MIKLRNVNFVNIINFIVDTIIICFNSQNYEVSKFNKTINYFNQVLYTSEFYLETQTQEMSVDAIDFYGTTKDITEMTEEQREKYQDDLDDDKEEDQAIDYGDEQVDAEGLFELNNKLERNEYTKNMFD